MTAEFESVRRYRGGTIWGILRSLALPLNDVRESECAAGCGGALWTREGHPLLRHPRAAGIPRSGAEGYVVVTMVEPFGGFFGRFAPSE